MRYCTPSVLFMPVDYVNGRLASRCGWWPGHRLSLKDWCKKSPAESLPSTLSRTMHTTHNTADQSMLHFGVRTVAAVSIIVVCWTVFLEARPPRKGVCLFLRPTVACPRRTVACRICCDRFLLLCTRSFTFLASLHNKRLSRASFLDAMRAVGCFVRSSLLCFLHE